MAPAGDYYYSLVRNHEAPWSCDQGCWCRRDVKAAHQFRDKKTRYSILLARTGWNEEWKVCISPINTELRTLTYDRMTPQEVDKAALTFIIAGSETSKWAVMLDSHSFS